MRSVRIRICGRASLASQAADATPNEAVYPAGRLRPVRRIRSSFSVKRADDFGMLRVDVRRLLPVRRQVVKLAGRLAGLRVDVSRPRESARAESESQLPIARANGKHPRPGMVDDGVADRPLERLERIAGSRLKLSSAAFAGKRDAGRRRAGRHQVDQAAQLVACRPGADFARPADEKRNPMPPLKNVRLLPAVVEIRAVAELADFFRRPAGPVVAGHDEECLIG